MIRFVGTTEPEFTRGDVALLAGDIAYRASLGSHGVPMDRATAKDARFKADSTPLHDKAAKALSAAQKSYYDQYPDADPHGDLWSVEEVPRG